MSNNKNSIILLLLLFINFLLLADDCVIHSFNDSILDNQSSPFLKPIEGQFLKFTPIPQFSAGQSLLRRKFLNNSYGLFIGRISIAEQDSIFAVSVPDSFPFETLVKTKFYINPDTTLTSHREIGDIIFSKFGVIYLIGTHRAYYCTDSGWKFFEVDMATFKAQKDFIQKHKNDDKAMKIVLGVCLGVLSVVLLSATLLVTLAK